MRRAGVEVTVSGSTQEVLASLAGFCGGWGGHNHAYVTRFAFNVSI